VIVANFAHNLEEILADTPIKTIITTELGDMLGGFKRILVNFVVRYIKKMVPAYNLPVNATFLQALQEGARHETSPSCNIPEVPRVCRKVPLLRTAIL